MKPNIKSRSREDQKNMMREKYITTFFSRQHNSSKYGVKNKITSIEYHLLPLLRLICVQNYFKPLFYIFTNHLVISRTWEHMT